MELDYQDEGQLLTTPPQSHKEYNTSPRRSPRLFRKEVTPSENKTSSPGKRTLSSEDHTQAFSQGKTTPRKEDGGYSRTVTGKKRLQDRKIVNIPGL